MILSKGAKRDNIQVLQPIKYNLPFYQFRAVYILLPHRQKALKVISFSSLPSHECWSRVSHLEIACLLFVLLSCSHKFANSLINKGECIDMMPWPIVDGMEGGIERGQNTGPRGDKVVCI